MEPVRYRITQGDYIAFQRLIQARAVPRFVLFMAGVALVVSVIGALLGAPDVAIGAFGGAAIGAIGLPLIARWIIIPIQARKAYGEYDLIKEEMALSLNDESFAISQASGNIEVAWHSVVLWREDDRMLTLHPTRHLAYVLPKAPIGEECIAAVKARLSASGLPRQGKRRK